MAASLTAEGYQVGTRNVKSSPFIYSYVRGSSTSINSSWTTHLTTPDWQLPAYSQCILYWYFPQRNDGSSWGGGYLRNYYRINSGGWQYLGHSGYSQTDTIMSYNGGGRIDSQCQSLQFDFSSLTNNFTLAFRFDFLRYNGDGAVVGSCSCTTGGDSTYTFYNNASGQRIPYGGCYSVSHVALVGQGYEN